jgi:hypothetical protein
LLSAADCQNESGFKPVGLKSLRVACGCGRASCHAMKSRYAMPAPLDQRCDQWISKQQSRDAGDPSRRESSLTAAPLRLCNSLHSLVRSFRYPAGFRNFIPKHAFGRYCGLTTDSLVKRKHGPPAGGPASFHATRWTLCDALVASEGRLGP